MMTVKFDLIETSQIISLAGLDPKSRAMEFANFAAREIAKTDRQNDAKVGFDLPYQTYVDGVASKNLHAVRPDGRIIAEWEFSSGVVAWVYSALREKAPVLTGAYRNAISIFADGVLVADPLAAEGAESVVIVSTVPYARKLEGISGKKYMSSRAPDGVFQVVAAVAAKRFRGQARISFGFESVIGLSSHVEAWASRRAAKRRAAGKSQTRSAVEKDLRNPAIIIRMR